MDNKRITNTYIVCLGGGTGTANLMKGLQQYTSSITVVLSMADEGGSGGRLRRLYNIPLGDMVACLTALLPENDSQVKKLLTYRFPGDRYGKDDQLGGHKIGNLLLIAMAQLTGDFSQAVEMFKAMFHIQGNFLPATTEPVTISARTKEGKIVIGEETIDLGQYQGARVLDTVFLHPQNARTSAEVVDAIMTADVVVCGPGDLYTTLLPVLIVPEITKAIMETKAKRVFVVNVANKPFETKNYAVSDFIQAVEKHLNGFPFDTVIVNNKKTIPIPKEYAYTYVTCDKDLIPASIEVIESDCVDENFPLYHDPDKLARILLDRRLLQSRC